MLANKARKYIEKELQKQHIGDLTALLDCARQVLEKKKLTPADTL
jgi:hypothetical protein